MDEHQEEFKPTAWNKLKRFSLECWRVLKITKKPTKEEFVTIVRAAALGMMIIGAIGFIISIIKQLFF